ncbi:putative major intrinsic protein [Helianthus annuus]|uniref:Major intrinsic protein n=1 Tax=Helianthus annuus TaxID=4232 RepID=A0A251SDG5_HELAN|nr:putative major intrinsic protein [Helianthus annuus]KAJ0831402.1 putative major intrinsic protein [Helianthus annuus]
MIEVADPRFSAMEKGTHALSESKNPKIHLAQKIKKHGGIAVGMTIMLNVFVGGASMNPTRSLGPAIVKWRFKGIWAYIIGSIIGAVTRGFVYKLLTSTEKSFSEIVKRSG